MELETWPSSNHAPVSPPGYTSRHLIQASAESLERTPNRTQSREPMLRCAAPCCSGVEGTHSVPGRTVPRSDQSSRRITIAQQTQTAWHARQRGAAPSLEPKQTFKAPQPTWSRTAQLATARHSTQHNEPTAQQSTKVLPRCLTPPRPGRPSFASAPPPPRPSPPFHCRTGASMPSRPLSLWAPLLLPTTTAWYLLPGATFRPTPSTPPGASGPGPSPPRHGPLPAPPPRPSPSPSPLNAPLNQTRTTSTSTTAQHAQDIWYRIGRANSVQQ